MGAKKLICGLTFLVFFILLNIANAQEDFTANSFPSVDLCPCSGQAYYANVKNTGSEISTYDVVADGEAAEWATFQPESFILEPGQEGSFYVIADSVCNIKGNYNLDIYITTGNGLTKLIKQALNFKECYDYSLENGAVVGEAAESVNYVQQKGPYNLCTNEQKSIPILIKNNENFGNIYNIFLDAPEWVKLNADSFELEGKNSGIVLIDLDATGVEGDFNFKLNAISELGKVQKKLSLDASAGECYDLGIQIKENDVICAEETQEYEVTIKNSGTLAQNIKLEADKNFASFNNTLFLNPKEEKIAILKINPSNDDVSESSVVTVFAIPEKKEIRFSDQISLKIISKPQCYLAEISAKSAIKNIYREDVFYASVVNNGIKKAVYKASLEGPSWITITPESLELNPGQRGNLNVKVDPGDDVEPNTYGIKISLESNGTIYSKNIDINLRKETQLEKTVKSTIKSLEYYFYLLLVILVLIIIFIKPLTKIKNRIKESNRQRKIKRERIRNLRIARETRQKEAEKERKKEIKIEANKTAKKKKKSKPVGKKNLFS